MNIAVCIKAVPNSEQYDMIKLDPVRKTVVREGIDSVINAADLHAIELAMQLKELHGGRVTLVSMGPGSIEPQLREGLAYGCDEAYIMSDRKFSGADSLATSYTLAEGLKKIGAFDLILLGGISEDGATAHVPSQLGEWLNLPHVTDVTAFKMESNTSVRIEKNIGGAVGAYRVKLPGVFGIDRKINKVRHPSVMGIFSAKKKPLTILTTEDFDNLDESRLGLSGSPTQSGAYRDVQYDRECVRLESVAELLKVIGTMRG